MNFQELEICRCQLCGHERLDKNTNGKDDIVLFKRKKKSGNNSGTQEIIDLINAIDDDDQIEEEVWKQGNILSQIYEIYNNSKKAALNNFRSHKVNPLSETITGR